MSALEDDAPRGFVAMREYLRLQRRVEELEDRLASHQEDEREEVSEHMIHTARLRFGLARQAALTLIAMANWRRATVTRDELHDAMGASGKYPHHASVVICKMNQAFAKHGAPRVIVGRKGPSGFYTMPPEAREWLQKNAPEIFIKPKGASR